MKSNLIITVLVIFFAVDHASAVIYNITRPCLANLFVSIEGCCTMPIMVSKDQYLECMGPIPGAERRAKDGILNAYRSFGGYRGGPGGPMCLIQCLLEKHQVLTENGDVDMTKFKTKLVGASATVQWRDIVEDKIKYCAEKISKIDNGRLPNHISNEKICKPGPALLSTCTKAELALACPTEFLTNSEECKTKLEKLKQCDVLAMRNSEFPMLRAHALRKNRLRKQGRRGGKGDSTTPLQINFST